MYWRSATLERATGPRMIDEHAAHHLCGNGEELRATLPSRAVLSVQTQPGLMNERGRLQGVPLPFLSQRVARLSPQLGIDESRKRLARFGIAGAPSPQQPRDLMQLLRRRSRTMSRCRVRRRWC